MRFPATLVLFLTILCPSFVHAGDTEYFRHIIFDNSLTPDTYFYSYGQASGSSSIEQKDGRLPVDAETFVSPPNALRLRWQSQANGGWEAEVRLLNFRYRFPELSGKNLYLWLYSVKPVAATDLPRMMLSTTREGLQVAEFPGSFSDPLPLGKFCGDLPAARWVQVRIALSEFRTASIYEFRPQFVQNVIFLQGRADGAEHTLLVDEIRFDDDAGSVAASAAQLPAPKNVSAVGYDRHVEVRWEAVNNPALDRYVIYRAEQGKDFKPIGIQIPGTQRFEDFVGKAGVVARYKVTAMDRHYRQSPMSNAANASTHELSDDELLTMVQEACFHYYWEGADPHSGMARENIPGDDRVVATGASGMRDRSAHRRRGPRLHYSRAQGVERLTKIVDVSRASATLSRRLVALHGRQHRQDHAGFRHVRRWRRPRRDVVSDAGSARRAPVLSRTTARQEQSLHRRITALWESVEWDWYREKPNSEFLYWHWSPQWTWQIHHPLIGFNEVMITYLLSMTSPTHSVPADMYYSGWAGQSEARISIVKDGGHERRQPLWQWPHLLRHQARRRRRHGGPLFFTHYSFMGFDPHALHDRFTSSYFDNNRNIALINRAYVIANPKHFPGYGADAWGLTASDGPVRLRRACSRQCKR